MTPFDAFNYRDCKVLQNPNPLLSIRWFIDKKNPRLKESRRRGKWKSGIPVDFMIKVIERLGLPRESSRGASNLKIHWQVNPRRIRDNSRRKSQPRSSEGAAFTRRRREKKNREGRRAALKTMISPETYLTEDKRRVDGTARIEFYSRLEEPSPRCEIVSLMYQTMESPLLEACLFPKFRWAAESRKTKNLDLLAT